MQKKKPLCDFFFLVISFLASMVKHLHNHIILAISVIFFEFIILSLFQEYILIVIIVMVKIFSCLIRSPKMKTITSLL